MYIGSSPNFGALDSQTITTANGSTATFTLNQYVPDSDSIIVTVGNVVQEPTEAYTASGNSITFTENVPNGDTIVIRYLGRSVDVYTGYKRVQDRIQQLLNDDTINARLTRFLKAPESAAAKADIINLAYAIAKAREPGGRFSVTDIDLALQSIGESSNKLSFIAALKRVGLFVTTDAIDDYVMAYNIADEDIPVKYNALVNNNKYFRGLEISGDIDPNSLSF